MPSPTMKTVLYPVSDLGAAKSVFSTLLGTEPQTDESYYVGYQTGELHIGLVPNGHTQGMAGPVAHWHVDDIEASVDALLTAGATVTTKPHDVGGGRLVATVADADDNPIGLIQG